LLPLAKNIKRLFSYKRQLIIAIIAVAATAAMAGAGSGAVAWMEKEVVINDNGEILTCKTMKSTFKETLEQYDIVVNTYDYVSTPLETTLQRKKLNEIYIKRAVPIYITADGQQTKIMTYCNTVAQALEDSPFKLEGIDRLEGAELTDSVRADMELKIVRVRSSIVKETQNIPYTVQRKASKKLDEGLEKIIRAGQDGLAERQYEVVEEDGTEVSRQLLSETILTKPINMIMEIGTALSYKTSRGEKFRYSKVLDMKATAYTASLKDTGKAPGHPLFGITATGIKAKKGVIAVDPKVIPLYTRVYVEIAGKTEDYGYAVAADVGGAIKGNKIDLYYDSQDFVDRFGVKKVKVYILE
jgi:uncharacterized protein YabE (DUF348 family)